MAITMTCAECGLDLSGEARDVIREAMDHGATHHEEEQG
jgi:hypothetical protein